MGLVVISGSGSAELGGEGLVEGGFEAARLGLGGGELAL